MLNQYIQIGGTSRTHDSPGNLTDDGTYIFGYDYQDRLVQLQNKSTQAIIASHRYDALGRGVERAVQDGATTRYVLDGQQVVEEYDGSDNWQALYVYEDGIDRPRCMDRADIADVNGNGNTIEILRFHYHQQALGSVTEMTQPTGAVVEWVAYDVYGLPTIRNQSGTAVTQSAVGNPYLYTGREYDSESGTYFYRARTYDPGTGRFLQRDPLGLAVGPSLYEYARSTPLTLDDPLGLDPGPVSLADRNRIVSNEDREAEAQACSPGSVAERLAEEKEREQAEEGLEKLAEDLGKKLLEDGEVGDVAIAGSLGALGAGAVSIWGDEWFSGKLFKSPWWQRGGKCLGGCWRAKLRGRFLPWPDDDEDPAIGVDGEIGVTLPVANSNTTVDVAVSGEVTVDSDGDVSAKTTLNVNVKVKF